MKKMILITFLNMLIVLLNAQTIEDTFNLSFQSINKGYRWSWLCTAYSVDFTLNNENTNRSLVITPSTKRSKRLNETTSDSKSMQNRTDFVLARTVILPPAEKKEMYSANLFCQNDIDSLHFIVLALDQQENILSADSIFIKPSENYTDNKINLPLCRARALRIIIKYSGYTAQSNGKAFRLRGVATHVNSANINNMPISAVARTKKTLLDNKAIIPLSFAQLSSLSKIADWNDKKIIGLGEFAHGSQEVKDACSQFIKYLTNSNHCRAILFEVPLDMVLRWDLYVQGILPDAYSEELKDELRSFFGNYQTTFELLAYLRKHNETAIKKIHVFGADNLQDNEIIADYLKKLGDNGFYSQLLVKREFKKLKDELLKKSDWIALLGKENFDYLLYTIDEQEHKESLTKGDYFNQRDVNMFKHVEKIAELYPDPSDKIVVYTHSTHVNELSFFHDGVVIPTMGKYLTDKYKAQYFAIAFQAGEGTYTQDSTILSGNTMTTELPIAPVYSFENAALGTGISYFYYPTTNIPEDICALRVAPRESRCVDNFRYCYLPKRFDALVFINKSRKLDTIEMFPAYYFSSYKSKLGNRIVKWLNEYLMSIKNTQNNVK